MIGSVIVKIYRLVKFNFGKLRKICLAKLAINWFGIRLVEDACLLKRFLMVRDFMM